MQTIFKSDFEFMQTFMTDLNHELRDCMVSCSAVYGDKSVLTRVDVDIADKNGDVFLSIDLFKTCQMVREGAISYSKVLASAITSAENAMENCDKTCGDIPQEEKESMSNEDNSCDATESIIKENFPEFRPEDVVVLAINRNKTPEDFEEACALASAGNLIFALCSKNAIDNGDEDKVQVYTKAELEEYGYKEDSSQRELFNEALKNTSEIYPAKILLLEDFVKLDGNLVDEFAHWYIVTTESGYNGCLASLYPSTLTTFTRKFKQGCYIAPIYKTCAVVIPDEYFTPAVMLSFQAMNKRYPDSVVSETMFHYDPNGFVETLDDFLERTTNYIFR